MQRKISEKYLSKSFWGNKKVLITGINGFIGTNLAKILISKNAEVIGVSNNRDKDISLKFENILDKIRYHRVDISNNKALNKVLKKYRIEICFHLAAQPDVNIARKNPFQTFESNIRGTYNLLDGLRKSKVIKSIIVASSDKAYGEYPLTRLPYKEKYDLRPKYPYDVSKACADLISKAYSSEIFKLPIITTRFSNIYGPGQLNFTALVPDCILALLKYRKFVPRGNGTNKRDFLFVNDVCELYLCLSYNLFKDSKLSGEVFNAGTNKGYSVDSIIKRLCLLKNESKLYKDIKSSYVKRLQIGEIPNQFMSYAKLKKYFGWKPRYSIKEGLQITIEWYEKFLKKHRKSKLLRDLKS